MSTQELISALMVICNVLLLAALMVLYGQTLDIRKRLNKNLDFMGELCDRIAKIENENKRTGNHMKTKFDIDEEVYIPGKIKRIAIVDDEILYTVEIAAPSAASLIIHEEQLFKTEYINDKKEMIENMKKTMQALNGKNEAGA